MKWSVMLSWMNITPANLNWHRILISLPQRLMLVILPPPFPPPLFPQRYTVVYK